MGNWFSEQLRLTTGYLLANKQLVQFRAIQKIAMKDYAANLLAVPDIFERICVEKDQIRNLAFFDGAKKSFGTKKLCRAQCCRLQCFRGGQTSRYEKLQFFMPSTPA
jgi:hypothetical protein